MRITMKLDFLQLSRCCSTSISRLSWFQLSCLFGGSVLATWKLVKCWTTWRRKTRILALITRRRSERDGIIRKLKTELTTSDVQALKKRRWITSLSARQLEDKLQSEELKPVEVLEAFQWAALLAHETTNCVAQFIVEARDWCAQLEQQYEGRDDKPPLFGLPFSVKESIGAKGYDATGGLSCFLFDPLPADSALVARLRQLGAVPFVLTNVPQTLLSYNCSNPIYGSTTNPKDPKRTCGGSTGGEAAILAFRGSAFGIGSDLAGSVRIPAHFCGVASLKPCSVRLSQLGGRKVFTGRSTVAVSYGPFANDVDTLVLFFEELLTEKLFSMDTYVAPIPFRRILYDNDTKLTIGYYDYDGFMEAVPACRRAVRIAKEILERGGHRLVKFTPPNVDKLFALAAKVLFIDAGHLFYSEISKDVLDPDLEQAARWLSLPTCVKRMIAKTCRLFGHSKLADYLGSFDTQTRDFGATLASVIQYKSEFNAEWRRLNLDAVICPPCASVAMPNGLPMRVTPAFLYACLYNILDYPAGIIPVTNASADDEQQMLLHYKTDEHYAKLIYKCNKEGTVGLPVGVQCVASTYNEEVCLRVMKEVEAGVGKTRG